ncbi:MAG TPA: metallophosphoesterase [Bryobacteraceae bacterium]|nr:metallophosphoesterase [Bryobacteraceae bacterium]
MRISRNVLFSLLASIIAGLPATAQTTWSFAVSGDSRNCGDVVMPAIAKSARAQNVAFYWHLGDYRAIYRFDQDYWQTHQTPDPRAMNIAAYQQNAWGDFITNQLKPFGSTPVFLAIGNHELIPPKTRAEYLVEFADWLDSPTIREQRSRDNAEDRAVRSYYHWIKDGIDFITLDNASPDEFDSAQLNWVKSVFTRDAEDTSVRALVVGMHEALPQSISADHSMDQSAQGETSGRQVYQWLLAFKQKSAKPVYVLASHSHFFMEGIFNTDFWHQNGGVLLGWIIGTAGAERYALPPNSSGAKAAKTHVYGYMTGTVTQSNDDPIHFTFHELAESDVPQDVVARYTSTLVHDCWVNNPPTK